MHIYACVADIRATACREILLLTRCSQGIAERGRNKCIIRTDFSYYMAESALPFVYKIVKGEKKVLL